MYVYKYYCSLYNATCYLSTPSWMSYHYFLMCHFINMSEMQILQDKFVGDVCMWPCVGLLHFPSACFKTQWYNRKKLDTAVIGKGKTKTADEPTNAACMREIWCLFMWIQVNLTVFVHIAHINIRGFICN